MKTIVLISCASKKQRLAPGKTAHAKDMYISPLFKKALAYANKSTHDDIYIISAKYGLLELNQSIQTYDETLKTKTVAERKKWSHDVLDSLVAKGYDLNKDRFIILAGKAYYKYLLGNDGLKNYECIYANKKIGEILHYLNGALK